MHICAVCGYSRLAEPPLNFTICPSCGTEFGYDDAFASHVQLRAKWLQNGAQWWSPVDARPDNWDPYLQVDAVTSCLWMVFRMPTFSQKDPNAFGNIMDVEHQQSRPAVPAPLRDAPKQTYTPQAA